MTDRMSMSELHKRFGTADDFTPSSDPIDNQRGLQRWVFTFVTRAGDEPQDARWLMRYAEGNFFDATWVTSAPNPELLRLPLRGSREPQRAPAGRLVPQA